ncbi:ubiquinone biosynthesis monooxygenase COQ6, mitochondrial [Drosophila grimshawi]|uniref:Ubiquinone biosynthesis monooxygenase COQ6, mitochondrial n=1 Tax=Drosophila grimshawi TaxID=7222 RepID=B4JAF7_DROGR|nr:ubiquinone biosynthesis monooxygenase COQ6, mitochondrial [Drosophila grimshawi]EDW03828.1 GH11451 [Drosophila grimshawi]
MLILLCKNSGAAAATQVRSITKRLLATAAADKTTTTTTKSSPAAEHFDIIIGGGGLVGTTLAAALAKNATLADKKVLLLEGAGPFKGFDVNAPYQNRVSAINRNSIELFKSIDAWQHIEAARCKPVKQMQVWESNSDALIQFQHDNFASDVACIIENDLILDAVYARVRDSAPNVKVLNQARIECVGLPGAAGAPHSQVKLQDGRSYTCELLIGADGANSVVRKEMGVDVFSLNYERMGLVATLDLNTEGDCDNSVAWQRFLPSGPIALLPLSDKQSSLVWSTTVPHAKQLLAMEPAQFVDALNEAFCRQYPRVDVVDKALQALNAFFGNSGAQHQRQYPPRVCGVQERSRATFPLGFLHASSYVCNGAALVGDAAHRVHPLAGQGVNLGFGDVRILVDTLATGAYAGFKLGDTQHLIKYERKCLAKNVPIMVGVHGLHTLYSTEFSPVVLMRSLGLQLTQNFPPIKNLFMKSAMG